MSYDQLECSNYDGIPTNLYEFSLGYNYWRYASGENDVAIDGLEMIGGVLTTKKVTYTATPISDSGIVQSGDTTNDDFTVTMPFNSAVRTLFIGTPPSSTVYLTMRRCNRGDEEAPIVWVGEVRSTKVESLAEMKVVCRALTATLNRPGLRLSWGRGCPHALYDRNCRVNKASYAIAIQIQGLTGAAIVSSALGVLPSNHLSGGFFEFERLPGVLDRRAIESHSGSGLIVLGTTYGLSVGDWITVYPGCNRTASTCNTKFNNLANYGGFPHMPSKTPFGFDPIF